MQSYEIFADGACEPNPGPGGWGVIIRDTILETELSGGEPATTNNRMELMAVIMGLEHVKDPSSLAAFGCRRRAASGDMEVGKRP